MTDNNVLENCYDKLLQIQKKIVCGKEQYNSFGKYRFRSCEDILKAFNALDSGCAIILSDEIVLIGDRYYIKATAQLIDCDTGKVIATNTSLAREATDKKGMDEAQITGAASSYARKYALCGLFALDSEDDADKLNTSKEYTAKSAVGTKISGKPIQKVSQDSEPRQKQQSIGKGKPVDIFVIEEILQKTPSTKGLNAQNIYDKLEAQNWWSSKSNKPITAENIQSYIKQGWL